MLPSQRVVGLMAAMMAMGGVGSLPRRREVVDTFETPEQVENRRLAFEAAQVAREKQTLQMARLKAEHPHLNRKARKRMLRK